MGRLLSDVSRTVVRIVAYHQYEDGTYHPQTSVMTGFFWKVEDSIYLITNWHNATGLNSVTLKPNGSFCPTTFRLHFFLCVEQVESMDKIVARQRDFNLYDQKGEAAWKEHSKRNLVDIVALSLDQSLFEGGMPYCLNEINFETTWQPEIGTDCFVVGFPEGLTGPCETPIWKRGSIASEPGHAPDEFPNFWIDTLGNPGLSGSPVIGQGHGILVEDGTRIPNNTKIGSWQNFIGIYSGRSNEKGVGFQLGIVWKSNLLNEIIEAGVTGHNPELRT